MRLYQQSSQLDSKLNKAAAKIKRNKKLHVGKAKNPKIETFVQCKWMSTGAFRIPGRLVRNKFVRFRLKFGDPVLDRLELALIQSPSIGWR